MLKYIFLFQLIPHSAKVTEGFVFVIIYTGYSQKNGAVSKVNKKSISQLTRVKRTPSTATVQVSHTLPAVRF
jgi:hypothetical protein